MMTKQIQKPISREQVAAYMDAFKKRKNVRLPDETLAAFVRRYEREIENLPKQQEWQSEDEFLDRMYSFSGPRECDEFFCGKFREALASPAGDEILAKMQELEN